MEITTATIGADGDIVNMVIFFDNITRPSVKKIITYSYFAGFILDGTGSYQYVFMFAGSILLLAAVSLILIPFAEAIKRMKANK